MHDHNTTRRAFLRTGTAAVATVPVAALPALAAGSIPLREASPKMLAMLDEWRAAERAYSEAGATVDATYERFQAARPPVPTVLFATEKDRRLRMPEAGGIANLPKGSTERYYTAPTVRVLRAQPRMREELAWEPIADNDETFYLNTRETDGVRERGVYRGRPWPEAQARADEIVAAWDRFEAETDAAAVATGHDKADAILDPLHDVYWEAAAAIIGEPARNLADALLKCEIVKDLRSWQGDFDEGVRGKLKSEGMTEDATGLVIVAELLALAQGRVAEPWLDDELA